jgi:hypothetical protein
METWGFLGQFFVGIFSPSDLVYPKFLTQLAQGEVLQAGRKCHLLQIVVEKTSAKQVSIVDDNDPEYIG